jgi:hypothetical protein
MPAPSIIVGPFGRWTRPLPVWPTAAEIEQLRTRLYGLRVSEQVPKGSPAIGVGEIAVTGLDLLLCAGLLSGPAANPSDRRIWSVFIEHESSLCHAPDSLTLRVADEGRNWDSHVKRGFSDRLGMGLAGLALWEHYGIVHIAHAEPFIGRALTAAKGTAFYKKFLKRVSTDGLKPDFFCLDQADEAVVAEAKGRIGTAGAIGGAIKHGKKQVKAVTPTGVKLRASGGRLVLGLNARFQGDPSVA